MRSLMRLLLIAATVTASAYAASRTVTFSQDEVGQPPRGFEFGHTAGIGRPGQWIVRDDDGNRLVAQTDTDQTRARFALAILADVVTMDADLSVRLRPISGQVDQAGGLVWRYQDQDNYYLVRANALEDNVVLYKVENGNAPTSR